MDFKNKKIKILLVRHGKDVPLRVGGWSDSTLSVLGKEEAKKLGETIKKLNFKFDEIVSSDLPRAKETSEILASELGLPVSYDAEFREINNGDLKNLSKEQTKEKYPGLYFFTLKYDECYPNGESPAQFFSRVTSGFENFVNKYNDKTVILVTHKGVIDILMTILYKRQWSNKAMPIMHVGCGESILIDIIDDDIYINDINEL